MRLGISQRGASRHREEGLGAPVDDLELHAGLVMHPLDEMVGIARHATGFRRDQPGAVDAARMHLVAADQQRFDGPVDGVVVERDGAGEPLAEAHDAREGVDDTKAGAGGFGDEQAAIVRAEIKRRIGRARPPVPAMRPMLLRVLPRRLRSRTVEVQSSFRLCTCAECTRVHRQGFILANSTPVMGEFFNLVLMVTVQPAKCQEQ